MGACLDLRVLADSLCCSCEVEKLDKGVGAHVKGRGYSHVGVTLMSGLLSFLYPSPDIYICLEVPAESSGFLERLFLVTRSGEQHPRLSL